MLNFPDKNNLLPGKTAGEFATAISQLCDFITQYIPSNGDKPLASNIAFTPDEIITAINVQEAIKQLSQRGGLNNWQPGKVYEAGDICYSANAPSYVRMECVVAGTTGDTSPECPNIGQYATDGSVTWIMDDVRDGRLPGDIRFPAMSVRDGEIRLAGQLVNRADYPRLVKFAISNNLIVSETEWAGGMQGLFGMGNGSTTIHMPDIRGYFIRVLDDGKGNDPAITRTIGSRQSDALQIFTGTFAVPTRMSGGTEGAVSGAFSTISPGIFKNAVQSDSTTGAQVTLNPALVARTDIETRPKNIAYNAAIK